MSHLIDFKISPITHDLVFENRDLAFVTGIDYYRQKISIVLQFFFGEWYLDTTLGIKFFEVILIKSPDETLVNNLIKAAILEVDGMLQILEYDSIFNKATRTFSITGKVLTDAGAFTLDESFNIVSST